MCWKLSTNQNELYSRDLFAWHVTKWGTWANTFRSFPTRVCQLKFAVWRPLKTVPFPRQVPECLTKLSENVSLEHFPFLYKDFSFIAFLGQVQTRYFTWAESNANEQNPLFSLIFIRFGSCEVRRLNRALVSTDPWCLKHIKAWLASW